MNKFNQIFLDIEKKIQTEEYASGTLLPSENELTKIYKVSRETIRKALNLLLEQGYIQKVQGKGSIVLENKIFQFPISGLTSYKELDQAQNIQSKTIVLENKLITTPKDFEKHSELSSQNGLRFIKRQRLIGGKTEIIDIDFFDSDIVPKISNKVARDSIYEYLENKLGFKIGYAKKEITVEKATEEDKLLMGNLPYVVVVRSDVFLEDTTLFQHTESRHTLDKFKFIDFARRRLI